MTHHKTLPWLFLLLFAFATTVSAEDLRPQAFSDLNLKISLPDQIKRDRFQNGILEVAGYRASDFFVVKYDSPAKETAKKILSGDLKRQVIFENNQSSYVKPLDGHLLESSPIRWNKHYGHEFSIAYQGKRHGELRVLRVRQVLVNSDLYTLEHDSRVFLAGANADWLRFHERKTSYAFFDSMTLLKACEPLAKPQPETIDGRWVVVSEHGKTPETPTEIAFLGDKYFRGTEGKWGDPIEGIVERAQFEQLKHQPGCLQMKWPYAENQEYCRYEWKGELLQIQFCKSKDEPLRPADSLQLRRPGDNTKAK